MVDEATKAAAEKIAARALEMSRELGTLIKEVVGAEKLTEGGQHSGACAVVFSIPGSAAIAHSHSNTLDETAWLRALTLRVGRMQRGAELSAFIGEREDTAREIAKAFCGVIPTGTPMSAAAIAAALVAQGLLVSIGVPDHYAEHVLDLVNQLAERAVRNGFAESTQEPEAQAHNWTGAVGKG